jgi:S1-C subfamily serine protease
MRRNLAQAIVFGSWIACFAAGLAVGGGLRAPHPPGSGGAPAGSSESGGSASTPATRTVAESAAATSTPARAAAHSAAAAYERTLSAPEQATIELFRGASPSVVFITSIALRRDAWTLNSLEIPAGSGSGFVWDKQGHIVTNFHVIQNANVAEVTLADHTTWKASLVGAAPDKDLAVLRIEAPAGSLHPIPVGASADLVVGQSVFAIGNPFGLDQSLTTGVISALGREIESRTQIPIRDVIQTDAAINPGNSGGPLLDSAGRLIGVNTAIASPSGASAGVGFAIPVDTVHWVVPDLIQHGKLVRPALGVQIASNQVSRSLGVEGVLVLDVVRGSGAEAAGIRPSRRAASGHVVLGDVIVAVDGEPIKNGSDLALALEKRQVGEKVQVTVLRDQRRVDLQITLMSAS